MKQRLVSCQRSPVAVSALGLAKSAKPPQPLTSAPTVSHELLSSSAFIIQPQLKVSPPADPSEQEADRIANQIVASSENSAQLTPRAIASPAATPNAMGWGGNVPAVVHDVLRSPGRPLDAETRSWMEARFGASLAQVHIHTDAIAAQSASQLRANAYTVGNHIVFGAAQFAPQTLTGRRLLAHELTHIIQQTSISAARQPGNPPLAAASPPAQTLATEPMQIARQRIEPDRPDPITEPDRAEPLDTGPACSRAKGRGQALPWPRTAFVGERGFAHIPEDGHPGPGGLLVERDSVQIRITARWEEQIPDPSQRPRDQRGRRADSPQYFLSFNGWADDCGSGVGRPASSVQSGNLAIGSEQTVTLRHLRPGRYGLEIAPSTAAPERNRVLVGECEVT
ncbi:eCIS core domain-containing protein [Almyronema epifaneia]|uniref:DUF4157 domain-containing protein n=1 Tax=Almyronema epifaneia S1 TaxID=2991925 RepID=A0ABW6IFJ5_9CYAN